MSSATASVNFKPPPDQASPTFAHISFGHWRTQTFIVALDHDRLEVAQVIDGATNRELFEHHVETRLDQTLRRCNLITDVITRDNLSLRESLKAAATVSAIGGWFLLFPPYRQDLRPLEMTLHSSRHWFGKSSLERAKLSGKQLDGSITSSPWSNATISSMRPDMKHIRRNAL